MNVKSGSKGDLVQAIQKRLIELDYCPGPIDGDFGEKTKKALMQYQKVMRLKVDGIVSIITAGSLRIDHLFHVPEKTRRQLKALLASNPNYFGNFPDSGYSPESEMLENSKYEEISCLGFNPDTNILAATVQVKLPYGYGGNQCAIGTMEHIRFYIDYGAGWEDLGLGGFKAWDLPNGDDCAKKPNKPLSYVVSIDIDPKKKFCATPVLPKVRAILSWEVIPPDDSPDWSPSWGNVAERNIQIKPRPWFSLIPFDFIKPEYLGDLEKLPIPELIPADIPGPPPVGLKDLAELYGAGQSGKSSKKAISTKLQVEPSRFGHSSLKMMSTGSPIDGNFVAATLAEWKDLNLDFDKAFELLEKTSANTSYEELYCLGLDPNRDWLEATLKIKKPGGYSGSLCKAGSKEYISFWVDWDNECNWVYLDTVEITTHDIPNIPADGLSYTAHIPVDLDDIRRQCSAPKIARVRAVLSWNQPPSTTDPDKLNHYGNRLDTHIHIRPAAPKALIERIGGVPVPQINDNTNGKTAPLAQMMPRGNLADHWGSGANECPFGGNMYIVGKQFNEGKYRLRVRPAGNASAEEYVKTKFYITKGLSLPIQIVPDPVTGFINYADVYNNHDSMLGHWNTGNNSGLWEIQLERVIGSLVTTSMWHKIYLDNIEAHAEISLDAGACKTFNKNEVSQITGKFIATDMHFAGFKLRTLPTSISPPAAQTPGTASSSSGSITTGRIEAISPGRDWALDVTDMIPCGYVMEVYAYDQTIRNNHSNAHSRDRDDVGFCLIEK